VPLGLSITLPQPGGVCVRAMCQCVCGSASEEPQPCLRLRTRRYRAYSLAVCVCACVSVRVCVGGASETRPCLRLRTRQPRGHNLAVCVRVVLRVCVGERQRATVPCASDSACTRTTWRMICVCVRVGGLTRDDYPSEITTIRTEGCNGNILIRFTGGSCSLTSYRPHKSA
jgi:hypothetical protein